MRPLKRNVDLLQFIKIKKVIKFDIGITVYLKNLHISPLWIKINSHEIEHSVLFSGIYKILHTLIALPTPKKRKSNIKKLGKKKFFLLNLTPAV